MTMGAAVVGVDEAGNSSLWSREQDKSFENALATHPDLAKDSFDMWENIAAHVPGKSLQEIKHHYELLVDDVNSIELGRVPLPSYNFPSASADRDCDAAGAAPRNKGANLNGNSRSTSSGGGKPSRSEQDQRRKGIAWTEEEHRLFLLGLDKYGKGDWRSISRNFVVTRTPTQVASHAQKYFIRLNSVNKDRRRSSIHDITSVDMGDLSGPITGQGNCSASAFTAVIAPASGNKSSKQPPSTTSGSAVGAFDGSSAVGQSMAVGTPVSLPVPPIDPMSYGAPMNVGFSMPPASVHR